MNYKDFYTDVLCENVDTGISSENTEIELLELGYLYLKCEIEKLNKKAAKWNVSPMELKVLNETPRKIVVSVPINIIGADKRYTEIGVDETPNIDTTRFKIIDSYITKKYVVKIEGKPPIVEGYQFIAKIEHTSAGNIVNFAPSISEKSVPEEYRNANQSCDVCNHKRERFNTFILRLTKEDVERFPNKKTGDYIMVGSACLKRFLPGVSVSSLVNYAEFLNDFLNKLKNAQKMLDDMAADGSGGGGGIGGGARYESVKRLLTWLSGTYIHTGKYISKTKADQYGGSSTPSQALAAMYWNPQNENRDEIYERMHSDDDFKKKSEKMAEDVLAWAKVKDFKSEALANPLYDSLYRNLDVVSKLEYVKRSNYSYVSAMFGMYVHDINKKQASTNVPQQTDYLGTIGQKVTLNVEVKNLKSFESSFGRYGGTSYIISMYGEEKGTNKKGPITYFSSNPILEKGERAEIVATVKNHQINKYTNKPETLITRAKIINKL